VRSSGHPVFSQACPRRVTLKEDKEMKKILVVLLSVAFACTTALAQNANSSTTTAANPNTNTNAKPRKPIFRANKDQIKQAQAILKQRNFYAGEETGKLDDDTRAGLRKYQEAEKIKVTGTLNKVTLEKMGVTLTDKQKAM
jgi:peptidoglycan hydrolase-like protein with peptidoglycan-binding domain